MRGCNWQVRGHIIWSGNYFCSIAMHGTFHHACVRRATNHEKSVVCHPKSGVGLNPAWRLRVGWLEPGNCCVVITIQLCHMPNQLLKAFDDIR
jgi:hypothetical protein